MARALALGALCLLLACLVGCGGGSEQQSPSESQAKSPPAEENAEASIEGYGEEAEGSQREEVKGTFHSYLEAIAQGDEQSACSHLAARVSQSLSQLAAKAKKQLSCPELLEALLSPQAAQIAKGQAEGKVVKVRVKGDTAFLVFHAPGARLWQLTLVREGEGWKVATLSASVLGPLVG